MRWISLGVLAVAGIALALFWGDVPDRWITHWGAGGQADGWATKSALAAAAPLLIGLAVWVVFEAVAFLIGRATAALSPGFSPEMIAVQATALRGIGLGVTTLMAAIALMLPLLRARTPAPIVALTVAVLGASVTGSILWAARRTRRLRESGAVMPEGYRGLFYSDPRDPRLWVPRTSGLGWTLNFAHKKAWPTLLALLCLPVTIILITSLLAR